MHAKLKLIRDSDKSRVFDVTVPQFVIGRGDGCQLRPNSDAISRRHCAVLLQNDKVVVRDLGSRNGTFVNDLPIGKKEEPLVTGDKLQVGPLKFEVTITDDAGVVQEPTDSRVMHQQNADESGDSGLLSQWLLAADMADQDGRAEDPETRNFILDQEGEDEEGSGNETITLDSAKSAGLLKGKKKKEPGKLPPPPKESTANTQEAAAETLKKLFTRGT